MRRALLLAALAGASACGPEPDRGLLYAHPEARAPYFRLDGDVWRAARPGAGEGEFPAVKAPGVFRVFVLGGSIANIYRGPGDLADALPPLLPGRRLELVNCGMSGYDAAREELLLREVLRRGADAVVLLTGHNESTALPPPLPRWRLRLGLWAVRAGLVRRPRGGGDEPEAVKARLAAFEAALRRMARAAKSAKAALVLVRPPLNLRDGAPQAALPRTAAFRAGWTRRLLGDCPGARAAWAKPSEGAAPADASVLAFLSARCLEREGRAAQARQAYLEAESLDEPLRSRCSGACGAILERVAAEEGALLADARAEFIARSAPRLPGQESFHDRIHWRPERHAWVSAAVAAALARARLTDPPAPSGRGAPTPPGGEEAWAPVLRYAARDIETAAPGVALTALPFLQAGLAGWRAAPKEPKALLAALAERSEEKGAAWGMESLGTAASGWARHLALARLLAGDEAGAGRAYAAAGPPADWEDELDRAALAARASRAAGAAALKAAWAKGETAPDWARDRGIIAAAAALGLPAEGFQRAQARAREPEDPDAAWTKALSAGALEAQVERDPAAARAAAGRLLDDPKQAGLAERLLAALGDGEGALKAACRPGRGADGALACARRRKAAGRKEQAAQAARGVFAAAPSTATARAAALLLQDLGEAERAGAELWKLSESFPKDAGLACDAGTALFLAGRRGEAAAAFTRARAADAASRCAASGLGLLGR